MPVLGSPFRKKDRAKGRTPKIDFPISLLLLQCKWVSKETIIQLPPLKLDCNYSRHHRCR